MSRNTQGPLSAAAKAAFESKRAEGGHKHNEPASLVVSFSKYFKSIKSVNLKLIALFFECKLLAY
jgi:hypothetical protein